MRRRPSVPLLAAAVVMSLTAAPAPASGGVATCLGVPATIVGTSGPDLIQGTSGPDVIVGLGGDDVIYGGGGDDRICGGGGNDRVLGGPGDDVIAGGAGDDLLYGGGGDDLLYGGGGDDLLWGGRGNDVLKGGSGDDVLRGFAGRDLLQGGGGRDALDGGHHRDRLRGGGGDDILLGGGDRDQIRGGAGSDAIEGGGGEDRAFGGAGTDLCSGVADAEGCEVTAPGLGDWLRTPRAEALAARLQGTVVLQTGCESLSDLDWASVAAAVFPGEGGEALAEASADLRRAAGACNADEAVWRSATRDALVHLEDFNAVVAGGAPHPLGPAGSALELAPMAVDVAEAVRGHLLGGNPPEAESDFWWGLIHGGHARLLAGAARAGGYDALFVGSSTMANALVPESFASLDGRTAYNASLPASGPEIQSAWLLEEAIPAAVPDVVVIGVEPQSFRPYDLVPGTCAYPITEWQEARHLRAAAFGPVAALDGTTVADRFFGDPPGPVPTRPVAAFDTFDRRYGPLGNRDDFPPSMTMAQKEAARAPMLSWTVGYDPCNERLAALGGTVAALDGLGIEVVVVGMPISDVLAAAFDPSGTLDPAAGRLVIADLLAEVAAVVTGAGGRVVDLSNDPAFPEERFRDVSHLDEQGAAAFTTLLAGALAGP